MLKFFTICTTTFSILLIIYSAHAEDIKNIDNIMVYEFEAEFESARDDLKEAIESRGMVISYISHAKAMLDRTASSVDITQSVYPTGAEIMLFCKVSTSHQLVQANPHYISLCPYAISVYDIQNANGKVFLSYRKALNNTQEYQAIENLLKEIIEEVIED